MFVICDGRFLSGSKARRVRRKERRINIIVAGGPVVFSFICIIFFFIIIHVFRVNNFTFVAIFIFREVIKLMDVTVAPPPFLDHLSCFPQIPFHIILANLNFWPASQPSLAIPLQGGGWAHGRSHQFPPYWCPHPTHPPKIAIRCCGGLVQYIWQND